MKRLVSFQREICPIYSRVFLQFKKARYFLDIFYYFFFFTITQNLITVESQK